MRHQGFIPLDYLKSKNEENALKGLYYELIEKREYSLSHEYDMLEKKIVTETQGIYATGFFCGSYLSVFNTEWFDNNGKCAELTFEGNLYAVPYDYEKVLKKYMEII